MAMRAVTIQKTFKTGDIFNYYLMSDLHIESPEHDRKLLIKELEYAKKNNADIFIGGDIFDFINNGDRKRYTPSRNKYEELDAVINEAIDEAFEILKPYAKNIKVMLCGNHESSVIKHHSFDPAAVLTRELNKLSGVDIKYLGYQGYIRLKYSYAKGKRNFNFDIKAHHGTGGAAEITKGTITINRFMNSHIADLYWSGHTHTKVILPDETQSYMNLDGNICTKSRKGIITAAYVCPVKEVGTTRNGKVNPYNIDYGDTKRTLQSTGGVMFSHEFETIEGITTRIIS